MVNCCHVDDFLHAGEEHLDNVMAKQRKHFSAGKVEEKCFDYISSRSFKTVLHSAVGRSAVCDYGIS